MTHLTVDTWKRLQAGRLEGPERDALLAHLEDDCDDCDGLVAALEDPTLDCMVDCALATLPVEPVAPPSLLFRRLERRVVERALRPRSGRAWLLAVPLALAASAALFIVLPPGPATSSQRLKGAPQPTLSAMVALRPGGPLEALEPGRVYPSTAELYFTYDLPADAHVYLGRLGADGVVEAFYPPVGASDPIARAGLRPLTIGGIVHAYSLEGLRGRQRFIVLSSSLPLEGAALNAALTADGGASASLSLEVAGW